MSVRANNVFNKFEDVSRIYEGYFMLTDTASPTPGNYIFDRIAELSSNFEQLQADNYGTFGNKKVAVVGYEGDYTVRVSDTSDLYSATDIDLDATSGTGFADDADKVTISYFLKNLARNRLVPATFSGIQRTDTGAIADVDTHGNQYILHEFKGFFTGASGDRNIGTGIYERVLGFKVISVERSMRTADKTLIPISIEDADE